MALVLLFAISFLLLHVSLCSVLTESTKTQLTSGAIKVAGTAYISSSDDTHLFVEPYAVKNTESALWSQISDHVIFFSKGELEETGFGCYCEEETITDLCNNGLFTKEVHVQTVTKTHSSLETCTVLCEKVINDPVGSKTEQTGTAGEHCPFSILGSASTYQTIRTTVVKVKVSVANDRSSALFISNGVSVGCSIRTGFCTGTEGTLSMAITTITSSACSHLHEVRDDCAVFSPMVPGLHVKVICEHAGAEYFLTLAKQLMPACAGSHSAYKTTTGGLVSHSSLDSLPRTAFLPASSHELSSELDYLIRSLSLRIAQGFETIDRKHHELAYQFGKGEGVCPALGEYSDGIYATAPSNGLMIGKKLAAISTYWVYPTIFGSTVSVQYELDGALTHGFIHPPTRIISVAPCGRQSSFAAWPVNGTHALLIQNGSAKIEQIVSPSRVVVELLRAAGDAAIGVGTPPRYKVQGSNIGAAVHTEEKESALAAILTLILTVDVVIYIIVIVCLVVALLGFAAYKLRWCFSPSERSRGVSQLAMDLLI